MNWKERNVANLTTQTGRSVYICMDFVTRCHGIIDAW